MSELIFDLVGLDDLKEELYRHFENMSDPDRQTVLHLMRGVLDIVQVLGRVGEERSRLESQDF